MNPRLTMLTAGRVLRQIRADHRTIALLLIVPCVLLGLLAWIFEGTPAFDRVGPALLGVFPFVVMFIVTSVATLRERTSGTLERLLAGPLGKADFMFGYALAFGFMAIIQALVATAFAVWVCGLDVAGRRWLLVVIVPSRAPSSRRFSSCLPSCCPSFCCAGSSSNATNCRASSPDFPICFPSRMPWTRCPRSVAFPRR